MEYKPLLCGLLLICLARASLSANVPKYRIEEVELPDDCSWVGYRFIINDNGDLVISGCGGTRFKKKGGAWQVVEYEGNILYFYNMNTHGVITGESDWGDAVVWYPDSSSATLLSVNGQRCVTGGVSDDGTVLFLCGWEPYFYDGGEITAFRDVSYPFSTENLYPTFIANSGMLHGWHQGGEDTFHPMVISEDGLIINESIVLSLAQIEHYIDGNDVGQSVANMDVGYITNVYGADTSGTMDVESFQAERINNHGTAVGTSPSAYTINHLESNAAIWNEEIGLRDLNDLVVTPFEKKLVSARSINNLGQIVCISLGGPYNSERRAYILTEIEARSVVPFRTRFDSRRVEIVVPGNWEEGSAGIEQSDDLRSWVHLPIQNGVLQSGEYRANIEIDTTAFLRAVSYKGSELE